MSLFVDTSVWSLALRRSPSSQVEEVDLLASALKGGAPVFTTGLILQEILQGVGGPKNKKKIIETFSVLPFIVPGRGDYIEAAELRNLCRRKGVQVGTIDALLAQLCIRHNLPMLTTDRDFQSMSRFCPLSLAGR